MEIRKKGGPNIDPCGTPDYIDSHSDFWPFKTTLWNLFFKKLLIRFNKVLEIPIDLSLKINPSCHTLSKTFDISKKTPRDSSVGY